MIALRESGMIEQLKNLLDELCSADLTLARAKLLRARLLEVVETLAGEAVS
jgi:hypothetical protein